VSARVLVLPSPLLGPESYQPLAEALAERGHAASVATFRTPISPDRLVGEWSRAAEEADVLVAHSNAGYLAPSVGARVGGRPLVFMDAALPPAHGPTRLAPPAFLETLKGLAGADGLLPPWTRWWPTEETSGLFPGSWFERVDASAPRVDLAYFETEIEPPDGWSTGRCGYLSFGPTYAAERGFAEASGWPVAELDGHHLWHLARPTEVAAALDTLSAGLSG
jgi:hypothetical protein